MSCDAGAGNKNQSSTSSYLSGDFHLFFFQSAFLTGRFFARKYHAMQQ